MDIAVKVCYHGFVVVVVNNRKATYSCFCPLTPEGQRPGAAVSGFFVFDTGLQTKVSCKQVGLRTQPRSDNSA